MKKSFIFPVILLFSLSSCGNNVESSESQVSEHIHNYDVSNIVWNWEKNSNGYDVFALVKCLECNEVETFEAIVSYDITSAPTCQKEGEKTYVATIVINDNEYQDTKKTTMGKTSHQLSTEWQYDEENHYHICEGCNQKFDESAHSWTDWTNVIPATYESDGKEERNCQICHYKQERTIEKLVPSKEEVQEKINKLNNSKFPYAYQDDNNLFYEYQFLSESDKASLTGYDQVLANKEKYDDEYIILSDATARTVRNKDADALGYAETWEGKVTKGVDDLYSYVDELDIQSVGKGWGTQHFNGVSFTEELVDASECVDFSFAIYNPNSTSSHCMFYTQGWYRIPNESTSYTLNPGWNDFTFDIKDGAFNSSDGTVDASLDNFSIIIMDNQVGNPWKITSFFGRKIPSSYIQSIIDKIENLPSTITLNDKDALYEIKAMYDSLTDAAKALITNYAKFEEAFNKYLLLSSSGIIDLIDEIPTSLTDPFPVFKAIDEIDSLYNGLTDEAKALVTNYQSFVSKKTAFETQYKVIFNPRTDYKTLVHEGPASCNDTTEIVNNENYGPVYKINASCTGGTYQTYTYNWPNTSYSSSNVLMFKIYSSFEAVDGTSQTFWVGNYNTATHYALNPCNWTSFAYTGGQLNSDGSFATTLNGTQSFLNLQRYANSGILDGVYTGTYYLTAIIAKL